MPDQLQLCHPKTVELRTSLYIFNVHNIFQLYLGLSPLPVRVTTRIVTFLVGNPYKPSFPLLLGGGTTQIIPILLCFLIVRRLSPGGVVAAWRKCQAKGIGCHVTRGPGGGNDAKVGADGDGTSTTGTTTDETGWGGLEILGELEFFSGGEELYCFNRT